MEIFHELEGKSPRTRRTQRGETRGTLKLTWSNHTCARSNHTKRDTKVQIQHKRIQEVASSSQSYEERGLDDPMMGILLQDEALISTRGSSPRGGLDLQEELLQEEALISKRSFSKRRSRSSKGGRWAKLSLCLSNTLLTLTYGLGTEYIGRWKEGTKWRPNNSS